MPKRIYLDNTATTPLDPKVALAMHEFEKKYYGNPSSIHREGQKARAKIDFARARMAQFINAKPQEIIFTSGATESNNLAIQGVVNYHLQHFKSKPHVIATELEHHSVHSVIKKLANRRVIEATFVKPSREGLIGTEKILKNIKKNTILISVIFISNEIGSVLPIREIGNSLATINLNLKSKILFHTDAVQAIKFYNCNVDKLGVDLMSISAHKINGPKGIGALYIKTGAKLENLFYGGKQEYELRPGTQNTTGIIGMAKAYELLGSLENRQANAGKITKIRNKILKNLLKNKRVELNGPNDENRSPDNINITVRGSDSDTLIARLDLAGIAASTGSACVSGSTEPSHVIKSLGKKLPAKSAVLRLTLDKNSKFLDLSKLM
jgi:cysteine desulfurase